MRGVSACFSHRLLIEDTGLKKYSDVIAEEIQYSMFHIKINTKTQLIPVILCIVTN